MAIFGQVLETEVEHSVSSAAQFTYEFACGGGEGVVTLKGDPHTAGLPCPWILSTSKRLLVENAETRPGGPPGPLGLAGDSIGFPPTPLPIEFAYDI